MAYKQIRNKYISILYDFIFKTWFGKDSQLKCSYLWGRTVLRGRWTSELTKTTNTLRMMDGPETETVINVFPVHWVSNRNTSHKMEKQFSFTALMIVNIGACLIHNYSYLFLMFLFENISSTFCWVKIPKDTWRTRTRCSISISNNILSVLLM